ncbi:MAG: molybdopterin dinucleotide binding domain-containing protein, partial [Ignisphaera sp.]
HPLYIHTQFEEVYGVNQNSLYISREDAEKLGLSEGDLVEIYNDRGSAVVRIHIDMGISRGIVWTSRQIYTIDGKRINVVLDDCVDRYGGATLNSTCIKIRKLAV